MSYLYLEDPAIARIVEAVGGDSTPRNLDRERLGGALRQSLARLEGKGPKQKRRFRQYRDEAREIAYHARLLTQLIERAPIVDEMLSSYRHVDADAPPSITALKKDLLVLEVVAENAAAEAQPLDESATKFWVKDLARVFEKYFKRDRGASNTGGKIGGPFVRFVLAVAKEVGIEIKPATIRDYMR